MIRWENEQGRPRPGAEHGRAKGFGQNLGDSAVELETLHVQMLGRFSIRCGDKVISDGDNRSRKVWLLLAYLICRREELVTQENLVQLCWGGEERSSDPLNALKTIFHRIRTALNQLQDDVGRKLVVRRNGCYAWNKSAPLVLDVDEFEQRCAQGDAALRDDQRLALYREALDLYQGDFLPKLAMEPWVVPISAYYHNLYLRIAQMTAELLEERECWEEAVQLSRRAVAIDPYHEEMYYHLIRNLLRLKKHQEAIDIYNRMSTLLFTSFGVMPSEKLRALYREAVRVVNERAVSMETLQEQLREPEPVEGVLLCDYDFFRILYHAEARAMSRTGAAVHLTLLSVTARDGSPLARRSLDRAMDNLQRLLGQNLRKGDAASRCSVSQFVVMLPRANYEDSCMVSERIIKAFYRQYPNSPARIQAMVSPVEPSV